MKTGKVPVDIVKEGTVKIMASEEEEEEATGGKQGEEGGKEVGGEGRARGKPRWQRCRMVLSRAAGGCMLEFYVPPRASK